MMRCEESHKSRIFDRNASHSIQHRIAFAFLLFGHTFKDGMIVVSATSRFSVELISLDSDAFLGCS